MKHTQTKKITALILSLAFVIAAAGYSTSVFAQDQTAEPASADTDTTEETMTDEVMADESETMTDESTTDEDPAVMTDTTEETMTDEVMVDESETMTDESTTDEDPAVMTDTTEETMTDEVMADENEVMEIAEDDEQLDAMFDEIQEVTDEESGDRLIVGEVQTTSEDYVVLSTQTGESVKVSTQSRRSAQRRRTATVQTVADAQPGQTLIFFPVGSSSVSGAGAYADSSLSITSNGKTTSYPVTGQTQVVRNGNITNTADLQNISDNTTVTAVTNADGDLVTVTLLDAESGEIVEASSGTSSPVVPIVLGVLALLIAIKLLSKKKKPTQTV